jgi:tRNA G18 (ribose-2'-O)-methylase SpoU
MFRAQRIESLDHPALAPYRTMRRPVDHVHQGIFVAEGEKVVRRLLEHPQFQVVSLLIPPKWVDEYRPLVEVRAEAIEVFVADKQVLQDLIGFSMYQGVLAVGKIPTEPELASVVDAATSPRLFVATDALSNAANMGAVVRNCVAFGVHALLVGETCSPPWLRRSVRSSMGTIFDLPVVESPRLVFTLRELKQRGVRVLGAHPHPDGQRLAETDLSSDVCIVVGSEGDGLRDEVLGACDQHVAIPMQQGVDSLNVTSATSVFLYEATRQRGRG